MKLKLIHRIEPNERIPRGYGIAYIDYARQQTVTAPLGINWLIATFRWCRSVLSTPRFMLRDIELRHHIKVLYHENKQLRRSVSILTEVDENSEERVLPDPTNYDTTDFPRKGCRQCGRRDRPQFQGICNDDRCSHEDL